MSEKPILVSSPLLPPLEEFVPYLERIWDSRWLTNNGGFHKELESELAKYLGVDYICLFTNGTLPIITALQAMEIEGEVITTPFSFVATTHSLWWNGIEPIFVDIDRRTNNLDPDRIEEAITPRTRAILPVHVYGLPCDTARIQKIADKHGLKVIYDAAHAFGVSVGGRSVLREGDVSTLSFHATKVYNTFEGGAIVCRDAEMKRKIDFLKNFGFSDETTVLAAGINSKLDEVRSAFGVLNLKYVDAAIDRRRSAAQRYRESLAGIPGISYMEDVPGVRHNYSYFPVFVDPERFGMSRDALYESMKTRGVFGRRYFYPLISSFPMYRGLASADPANLPAATEIADRVICLPMHSELSHEDVDRVVAAIEGARR